MSGAIRIVAALAVATTLSTAMAASASARVVRTFGSSGPERLRFPGPMVFGPDGLLQVVDLGDAARDPVFVRVYTPAGARVAGFRVAVPPDGALPPVAADAAGDTYVGIPGGVLEYSPVGALIGQVRVAEAPGAPPGSPVGVGVAADGRIVTFDAADRRFDTFDASGRLVASFRHPPTSDGLDRREGVSLSATGTIYADDAHGISVLDGSGAVARGLARPAVLGLFASVVDGPGGSAYVVAPDRIHKLGPSGEYPGAVGTDGEPAAAVGPDGSIYVASAQPIGRGPSGAIAVLAPITTVDLTPPAIRVRPFSIAPRRGRRAISYTLSEAAALRVSIKRRARTTLRRDLFARTVRVAATGAGPHRFVLDWAAFGYTGEHAATSALYEITFVAIDDAGNESRPARVRFKVRRR